MPCELGCYSIEFDGITPIAPLVLLHIPETICTRQCAQLFMWILTTKLRLVRQGLYWLSHMLNMLNTCKCMIWFPKVIDLALQLWPLSISISVSSSQTASLCPLGSNPLDLSILSVLSISPVQFSCANVHTFCHCD